MLRRLLPIICGQQVTYKKIHGQVTAAFCKQIMRNSLHIQTKSPPEWPLCNWSTLINGVRVITETTSSPLACVTLLADAGSRYETMNNNGACHFIEHMVCRGIATFKGCAFEEHIRDMGARLSIHTDREYQAFVFTCLQSEVKNIINLIPRMFCELECDEKDLQSALDDLRKQTMELEHNSKQLCFDFLHQTAFQGTSLSKSPIGRISNYECFNKCYIQTFIGETYKASKLILSVSSNYDHKEVKDWVGYSFRAFEDTCMETERNDFRYTGSMIRYRDDSMPYCHVCLAVETGGYCSSDYINLNLMKHMLGRWDNSQTQGYDSWPKLAHACALAKLCERYQAFYLSYKDVGLFGVYFVIKRNEDYDDIIVMIQNEWMKLCVMTAQSDFDRAKAALKLEVATAADGCVAACLDMGLQLMYYGMRYNLGMLNMNIDRADSEELCSLAERIMYDRCPVVSAIGPTEALPDYNRVRSGMYWLRT